MNSLLHLNVDGPLVQSEPATQPVRFEAQRQVVLEAPKIQGLMENIALMGGEVSTRISQTTVQSPDGTIIQEQSMNVWIGGERGTISVDEARVKRLRAMQEMVDRPRRRQ
jgi:hypothetical protein